MAIPVISEILSFLQSIITSMPKAMKYILFLFFLIILVWMMPLILHIFGFHCNHSKIVMSTPAYNFIGNMELAFADPNEIYNQSKFVPKISIWAIGDQRATILTRYIDDTTREECSVTNKTDCNYGLVYKSGFLTNKPSCINCTNYTCAQIEMLAGYTETECLCFSDAVAKSKYEMNNLDIYLTCNEKLNAEYAVPPLSYAYNHTDNTFTCIDSSVCGVAAIKVRYIIDEKLEEQNAEPFYKAAIDDKNIDSTIRLSCDNNLQPQITIFKIPIFNLQIWLAFFVLGTMFFFLSKIKRH